jgi:hypothetical protein
MSRAQKRFEKHMAKRSKLTFAPCRRKRKKEDKHIAWLWKKVQGGMQIELVKNNELTLSHRAFAKLVSLQERSK